MWLINAILILLGIGFAYATISYVLPRMVHVLLFIGYVLFLALGGLMMGALVGSLLCVLFAVAGAPDEVIKLTMMICSGTGFVLGAVGACIVYYQHNNKE